MSLDGLDSPRLDEKDCRFRHWGSGSPRVIVGSSVCDPAALACWRGGLMRVGTWAAGSESKSFPEAAGKNTPRDGRVR
jgi:hypothetical protein